MLNEYRQLNVPKGVERRMGITAEEYRERQNSGEKWCTGCKTWHPSTAFNPHRFAVDGLQIRCRDWWEEYSRRYRARVKLSK